MSNQNVQTIGESGCRQPYTRAFAHSTGSICTENIDIFIIDDSGQLHEASIGIELEREVHVEEIVAHQSTWTRWEAKITQGSAYVCLMHVANQMCVFVVFATQILGSTPYA
jgi:hypothetical protein